MVIEQKKSRSHGLVRLIKRVILAVNEVVHALGLGLKVALRLGALMMGKMGEGEG
jgi:hypothetical protein